MNQDIRIVAAQLIAKVGIDAAIFILEALTKVTTIEEAIEALKISRSKTWEDYKNQA